MFQENLNVYFRRFGETVLVGEPGNQEEMTAIFDNDYQVVSGSEYTEVSSSLPALTVKTADAEALGISPRTRVSVRGVPYSVNHQEPDGTGITVLFLWKKDPPL
jgi:hypothetical protein